MGLFPASEQETAELQRLCRRVLETSPHDPGKVWERAGSYHYVICYVGSGSMWNRCGVIYANVEDMRMHGGGAFVGQLVSDIQLDSRSYEAIVELGLALLGPLGALGEQAPEGT